MRQTVIKTDTGEFCSRCGRELQDVEESYWRGRGRRAIERYRECPKFPRNSFMNMMPPWRNCDSNSLDVRLVSRQYI